LIERTRIYGLNVVYIRTERQTIYSWHTARGTRWDASGVINGRMNVTKRAPKSKPDADKIASGTCPFCDAEYGFYHGEKEILHKDDCKGLKGVDKNGFTKVERLMPEYKHQYLIF
jgi:hypothetical protein